VGGIAFVFHIPKFDIDYGQQIIKIGYMKTLSIIYDFLSGENG
jgi:hypothetical protein